MSKLLLAHFVAMQATCAAYIADHETPAHKRDSDFIGAMTEALDSAAERAAVADAEFDYQALAIRTESQPDDLSQHFGDSVARLLHAAMGMTTETGEFFDPLKKYLMYGKPLNINNMEEEVGDLLWYIAIACDAMGTTIEAEMRRNIAKLKERYPDKFTNEHATNRDLFSEVRAMQFGDKTSIAVAPHGENKPYGVGERAPPVPCPEGKECGDAQGRCTGDCGE